jgi:hypothetical protein
MDNKQKPLTLKEKGYVRKKTITYTITERVRPLKKKSKQPVQLSFPFPSEIMETPKQPVKSSTETTETKPNINTGSNL